MNIVRSVLTWVAGLVILVVFFPVTFLIWLAALPFDNNRKVIHRILLFQSAILAHSVPVLKVHVEGKEKAKKNSTYVIISNHQSILDILIINCLGYSFKWVSKIENTRVPFLGWYLRMADYLVVDRNDSDSKATMIARAYTHLKNNTSIMIFPEGTRSVNGTVGFFKRGAFQLAVETGVQILPVIIDGTGDLLPRHKLIFNGRHNVYLRVLDPVDVNSLGTENPDELAVKFREIITSGLSDIRIKNGAQS